MFNIQEIGITWFYAAWRVNIHSRQRSLQESACQPDASASVSHFVWTTLALAPSLQAFAYGEAGHIHCVPT